MSNIQTPSAIFEDSRVALPLRNNQQKKHGEKPEYYLPEEIVCAVTHAIGAYLGAAAVVLLVLFAIWSEVQIPWKIVAGSIFGAAIIILYSASTLYHAVTNYRIKKVFQSVDEMAIYIMIAATYTPFCLVILRQTNPVLSWTILGTIWGMAIIGIFAKLFGQQQSKYVTPIPYLVMGWFGLVLIKPLIDHFAFGGFVWLILGGVLYSLGVVFYLWRNLPYNHAVWHVFVLAGTIAHFFCILFYVIM